MGRNQINYAGIRRNELKQNIECKILDTYRRDQLTTSRLARVAYIAMNPALEEKNLMIRECKS